MVMDTKKVGTYNRLDMARAMEALTGVPALDLMRVIVEPADGSYSRITALSKVVDGGKPRLDEDGGLVLRDRTFIQLTPEVQDAFDRLGIGKSEEYSVDAFVTYTNHGKYEGV